MKIAKDQLLSIVPNKLAMDEIRFDRFLEWLARRYDRPTVPDAIFERFHKPTFATLDELFKAEPALFQSFGSAIHDIRISFSKGGEPPYSIGVVYLTDRALTREQLAAIERVHSALVAATAGEIVVEAPAYFELDETPYGVIRTTQPLILDYLSIGDQDQAAPLWILEKSDQ